MSSNLLLAIALGLALVASDAFGAERTVDGEYEIVLFRAGKDYRVGQPTFETIGAPYESREACRVAITRVRIQASGVRLVCAAIETARVR